MTDAWQQSSPTRQTVCLNGLWWFSPVTEGEAGDPPSAEAAWNWFKVPGIWPGRGGRSAVQRVLNAGGEVVASGLRGVEQAWYRREIAIPAEWSGRRVLLDFAMLQTHAQVWIDGNRTGEVWFPGGRLDITQYVAAGNRQTLTLLVTARPLSTTTTAFAAPERDGRREARVNNKGIPGDVFLVSEPKQDALGDIHVITSTRQGTITLDSRLVDPSSGTRRLVATIFDNAGVVKELASEPFDVEMLEAGRWSFSSPWADAKHWDLDTPENMYRVVVRLYGDRGQLLDESLPIRFGFREFWIDGRDFYLNGTPVHLRLLHTENVTAQANRGSLEGCLNTCRGLKQYGFNAAITSAYDFAPGTAGYLDAFFEAADETGVLTAFTLPHIKDFAYRLDDPKQQARYKARAEWLIRRAQNHPSIVFYTMNHNSTGYYGDQNPLKIDGKYDPAAAEALESWNTNNRRQAKITVQIAERIDPTRVVYNHQSGNLGSLHTVNIYLNWAPLQERSDWLEHWATVGVKPVFFVEWGLPHISSWSSYRGPEFIWTAPALQQVWDSEYAAPYVGQSAYKMTSLKVKSMAHEEELWAGGRPFAWSNLNRYLSQQTDSQQTDNYRKIQALFASDNWRSHRAWGISAMLPWDQAGLWQWARQLETQENRDGYDNLKRPGIVPDVLPPGSQLIYRRAAGEFAPTVLGEAFLRWNQPLIGYIGGGPDRFTEKGHNFVPGESVQKQLVILNDARRPVTCRYRWRVEPSDTASTGEVLVEPGTKQLVPIQFPMPAAPSGGPRDGDCAITAQFDFGDGNVQSDSFALDAVQPTTDRPQQSDIAVFDPTGLTIALLHKLGFTFQQIDAAADLSPYDVLVLGREAISPKGQLPDLAPVKDGLQVLVFEQSAEALSERLGFRINVHGMRTAFVRTPSHAALVGLDQSLWHDWHGAATLTPPYLDVPAAEMHDPTWAWCGAENTRVWRCGNHGNVASVLIEKPSRGSFLPLLDCGFDLQYCPLLEYREGLGRIVFCQLDVTGRTKEDPAAEQIVRNLLAYVETVPRAASRTVFYAGNGRAAQLLQQLGVSPQRLDRQDFDSSALLVLGPEAEPTDGLLTAVENGANLLCLGLSQEEIERLLADRVSAASRRVIPSLIRSFHEPAWQGLSNADLHWRTTRLELAALDTTGEQSNEALQAITIGTGKVVLCQAAPWMFDYEQHPYLRTTYRRNVFLVSRLLANLGASCRSPLLEMSRNSEPEPAAWLHSYYVQEPQPVDDPYRYFRW